MASFLADTLSYLTSGFVSERLNFGDTTVVTTALLAEGGYSYVYAARGQSSKQQYAAKTVLAQDEETVAGAILSLSSSWKRTVSDSAV